MTIAVLIITVVFALLFFFCLFSKRGIGAIFSVCGCIGGVLNLIGFYEVNKPVFFIVGWILVAIGAIGIVVSIVKSTKEKMDKKAAEIRYHKELNEQEEREQRERDIACNIYKKCREKSIGIKNEEHLKSLLLISKSYGVDDIEQAKEYYAIGKDIVRELEKWEHDSKIDCLRNQDMSRYNKERNNALLYGKRKYTGYLEEELEKAKIGVKGAEYLKKAGSSNMGYTAQKQDWAIAGGLASGLAGGAAGVSAALDAQQRNANEEQRASQIREQGKQQFMDSISYNHHFGKELQICQSALDEINNKVIDFENINEKFEKLEFSVMECKVLESKNIEVRGNVKLKEKQTLIGGKALLDGAVKINIADSQGQIVGHGYYSPEKFEEKDLIYFKYCGFSERGCNFSSICIIDKKANENETYTCKVEPVHLWLIEC